MPWNGYNFEDSILISERIVAEDRYTSIHIEELVVVARDTKLGAEEITRDIPNVGEESLRDLDEEGIIRVGAEVRADDILVGKVAPKGQGELTPEERLVIAIFGKKAEETRDVSLRLPHGEKGKVIDVKRFSRFKHQCIACKTIYDFSKKPDVAICSRYDCGGDLERIQADELPAGVNMLVRCYIAQKRKIMEGDKMAGRHGNKGVISRIVPEEDMPFLPDGTPVDIILNPLGVPSRMNIGQIMETHLGLVCQYLGGRFDNPIFQGRKEADILGELKKLGEHFRVSRLYDYAVTELGLTLSQTEAGDDAHATEAAIRVAVDGLNAAERQELAARLALDEGETGTDVLMRQINDNVNARIGFEPDRAKMRLRDGRTGEFFDQPVAVGLIYMLKLAHLVDDKIHARSTGPYSLVTQQPLGGKAQFGGQRFGEMEVWALEAYGAAFTLQEILTIKSDDVVGRVRTYEAIVKGNSISSPGIPESFRILMNEMQSLGLRVQVEDRDGEVIDLRESEDEYGDGRRQFKQIMSSHPLPTDEAADVLGT